MLTRQWWLKPDHYAWLTEYIRSRGLQPLVRRMMTAGMAILSILGSLMLLSPAGPHDLAGRAVVVIVSAWELVVALLWGTRWPTVGQSAAFCISADIGVASVGLVQANALASLAGVAAFLMLHMYMAFFHTIRLLTLNLVIAIAAMATLGMRVAADYGDPVLALCNTSLLILTFVSIPVVTHAVIHRLGLDVVGSDVDPLSGLLNRRAFHREVEDMVTAHNGSAHDHLAIAMLDLDNFKRINDTRGHAAGDRAIVAVSELLRRHSHPGSIIARIGGEEFMVAGLCTSSDVAVWADDAREAIADSHEPMTVSVGVAARRLSDFRRQDTRRTIDDLAHAADITMFEAKRAGGNQTRRAPIDRTSSE